jgi:hypothetical protein
LLCLLCRVLHPQVVLAVVVLITGPCNCCACLQCMDSCCEAFLIKSMQRAVEETCATPPGFLWLSLVGLVSPIQGAGSSV